jgi:hypothetical protein
VSQPGYQRPDDQTSAVNMWEAEHFVREGRA